MAASETSSAWVLRVHDDVHSTLQDVLQRIGWRLSPGGDDGSWHLYWKTSRFSKSEYSSCLPFQRLNHFEGTKSICKKDELVRQLRRMQANHGACYAFVPQSFVVPREKVQFAREYERVKDKNIIWICKPASSSQGKNIYLLRDLEDLKYEECHVVQRYIPNPLLLGGYKFDMRVYVLVRSFRPLNVFVYKDGLARFSTEPYDLSDLTNLYSHLTNSSINKRNDDAMESEKNVIGKGCKWTLTQLFQHLDANGKDSARIWHRIKDIALLTLLPIVHNVPRNPRCFEIFGYDVMLDSRLKPWLIEVNASPAIAITTDADEKVKRPMFHDLMEAIGLGQQSHTEAKVDAQEARGPGKSLSMAFDVKDTDIGGWQCVFPFSDDTRQANERIDPTRMANPKDPLALGQFQKDVVRAVTARARRLFPRTATKKVTKHRSKDQDKDKDVQSEEKQT